MIQKISLNIETKDDIKEYASSYELAPIPLAHFSTKAGCERRQNRNISLLILNIHSHSITKRGRLLTYINRCFVLHKVGWDSNMKVHEILSTSHTYRYTALPIVQLFSMGGIRKPRQCRQNPLSDLEGNVRVSGST